MDRTWSPGSPGAERGTEAGSLRQEFSEESAGPERRVCQGWKASLQAATGSRG